MKNKTEKAVAKVICDRDEAEFTELKNCKNGIKLVK